MDKNILFYSGTGNYSLGAKMLSYLEEYFGKKCSFRHINYGLFPDGEPSTRIPLYEEIGGARVVLFQSIFDRDLLYDFLEQAWAIKKQYKAKHLIAVIPFLIFRRQDHDEIMSEICRLRMVIDQLRHAGVDEIITVSPHSPNMAKFCAECGIKMWEVDPSMLYASAIKTYLPDTPTIYAPDRGSILRAIRLARLIGGKVIFSLKIRSKNNTADIKIGQEDEIAEIIAYYKQQENFSELYYAEPSLIQGASIVMIEDEASTGETANKTGTRLKNQGARLVYFLVMHPVLSPGWRDKLFFENPFDKVIMGNTITRDYKKKTGGLIHDIDVAELMAQTLYKCLQLAAA